MGIEKIAVGGAPPYQGSSAAPAIQTAEAGMQTANLPAQRQNFSLERGGVDDPERQEEQSAVQGTQFKSAMSDLNKWLDGSEAIFGIHDKTNRVTIKIVDKKTKEVIKEYPPEQTLDIIAKVWEIAGILVDEKR